MPPPAKAQVAQLAYQVCPILLEGGIAAQMPDGILPMLNLLYPSGAANELPWDIGDINGLDDAFGAFNVLPGGTLISQTIGKYPMANQWVAANAVINEPLTISVIMDAPMRGPHPWDTKKSIFTSLQAALIQHNNRGGMYIVATPAFNYTHMVMLALTDNSRGNNSLPQNAWRFDFEKPLVTLGDAQTAYNAWLDKAANKLPVGGDISGIFPGQTSAHPEQGGTYPVSGYLTGSAPRTIPPMPGQTIPNYPALPSPGGLPYRGIS